MRWYREHGRHHLPWRRTRDPYAVLVSEVMLQQTQVDRVLPYYQRWLTRWPTIGALAAAPASELIREWRGLGYNRRALNLHRAALAVSALGSGLPTNERELKRLPGVGSYTAAAVCCFAGGANVVVSDTNIARVAVRVVCGEATVRDIDTTSVGLP
jgi:A/G-specific adenine glycosylase